MNGLWYIAMAAGAAFTTVAIFIALRLGPRWRASALPLFQSDFARTLRRADRVQPILLVVCAASTIAFAVSATGAAGALAGLGGLTLLSILVGSGLGLVPLQRGVVEASPEELLRSGGEQRSRWLRGHEIRTVGALASLGLLVLAVAI